MSGGHYKVYQWSIFTPGIDTVDSSYQRCLEAVLTMIHDYLPDAAAKRYVRVERASPVLSDSSNEGHPSATAVTEALERQMQKALRHIAPKATKGE
jgi:hypothetical protein